VTREIETKIKNISGIDEYSSISRDGVSRITVTFTPEASRDMTKAVGDIRSKVDEAKPNLPAEIDSDPRIFEVDSTIEPFLSVVVSAEKSPEKITDIAEKLRKKLENLSGVARAEIVGGTEREIIVEADREKLKSFGISLDDLVAAIARSHRDTPAGKIEINHLEYSVRFSGKSKTAADVENIVLKNLKNRGNSPSFLRVGDVARVEETGEDNDLFSRFFSAKTGKVSEKHFQNAVEISLFRKSKSDIFAAEKAVKTATKTFFSQKKIDASFSFFKNRAEIMREDYRKVVVSGLESIAIVMAFLFLFVGFREGLVASMIIPLTFLTTIAALFFSGRTLNFMTNFSMILSLGILVDTAIVIVEGAHFYWKKGFSPREAALLSLREFRGPLISGTLTTLAVFVPLLSLPGILGQFLSFIPITVILILSISLFLSLLLLPAFIAFFLPATPKISKNPSKISRFFQNFREKFNAELSKIISKYLSILQKILSSRARRLGLFAAMISLFVATLFLPIKFVMFPVSDSRFLTVSIQMPEGTPAEKTEKVAISAEQKLLKYSEVSKIQTIISGKSAKIIVELFSKKWRDERGLLHSPKLEKVLSRDFEKLSRDLGANIRVETEKKGPPKEFPVAFRVVVADAEKILLAQKIARDLTEKMREIPGTAGVKNDIENIPGEFNFKINRGKAMFLGINPDAVARTIRTAVSGTTAATITRGDRDLDIVVKISKKKISHLDDLKNFAFFSPRGKKVLLSQIADFKIRDALATVRREDGDIAFTVSSLLADDGNAAEITAAFSQKIQKMSFPDGIEVLDAGENAKNADLFADLSRGYLIAILLMFLILVIQFDRFLQPLFILSTILLAQIGVQIGLFLTGTPKSLAYILGTIALAGIVVNDAIILINKMNKNCEQKKCRNERELRAAILDAGKTRFVPVILTTLTTSAGIIPLIFQDKFWAGLSYTVIFGLSVASFLTLLVTPAMYFQFFRFRDIVKKSKIS